MMTIVGFFTFNLQHNNNNNNNNNNTRDNVYGAVIMTQVIAKVHPVHLTNIRHSARRPPTLRPGQPTWAVSPPVGCYDLHPPSPFIITQPESWHSFYRSTEGGRPSQPRHTACKLCHVFIYAITENKDKCTLLPSNYYSTSSFSFCLTSEYSVVIIGMDGSMKSNYGKPFGIAGVGLVSFLIPTNSVTPLRINQNSTALISVQHSAKELCICCSDADIWLAKIEVRLLWRQCDLVYIQWEVSIVSVLFTLVQQIPRNAEESEKI